MKTKALPSKFGRKKRGACSWNEVKNCHGYHGYQERCQSPRQTQTAFILNSFTLDPLLLHPSKIRASHLAIDDTLPSQVREFYAAYSATTRSTAQSSVQQMLGLNSFALEFHFLFLHPQLVRSRTSLSLPSFCRCFLAIVRIFVVESSNSVEPFPLSASSTLSSASPLFRCESCVEWPPL
jgi:hypothetical protein